MRNTTQRIAVAMLGMALVATPLVACSGGQPSTDGTEVTDGGEIYDGIREVKGNPDPKTWKTLGDAYAGTSSTISSSHDEHNIVCIFDNSGKLSRVVAEMTPEVLEQLYQIDYSKGQAASDKETMDITSPLAIKSAEDITDQQLTQEQLDQFVGKTGQDLVNDGFTFEYYNMYGNEETGASMAKGNFCYFVTFQCKVDGENDPSALEDGGAAVMAHPIISISYLSVSNAATDPSIVTQAEQGGDANQAQPAEATETSADSQAQPAEATETPADSQAQPSETA